MSLEGTMTIAPLVAKLQSFGPMLEKPTAELVEDECKTFVSSTGTVPGMVQITPPAGGRKGGAARGNAAKKQGENAIVTDLLGGRRSQGYRDKRRGVFVVMNENILRRATRRNGGYRVLWGFKSGGVVMVDDQLFKPDASEGDMWRHHREYFKNGRMTHAGANTRDIGRSIAITQMVVGVRAFNAYLKGVKSQVGLYASSLAGLAAALGIANRVPVWIKRHMGKFRGEASKKQDQNGCSVTMTMGAPFAAGDFQRRANSVVTYRINSLRARMRKGYLKALRAFRDAA